MGRYIEIGGIWVPAWSSVGKELLERVARVRKENAFWFQRLAPLAFGHYAWVEDKVMKVESAGSGIFVAPRVALSARHVSNSYELLDDRIEGIRRRMTVFDSKYTPKMIAGTRFSTMVYQLPDGNDTEGIIMQPFGAPAAAESGVDLDWASADTDITFMKTTPNSGNAQRIEKFQKFFQWQMLPPPEGAEVRIFGLPGWLIVNLGDTHAIRFFTHGDVAHVTKVYPVRRDCGSWDFAGFTIDKEFEHGMSGAAVFYEERLVGIFSGPDYVASLWPLAIHTYMDESKTQHSLADEYFDSGVISVIDWPMVKGGLERMQCADIFAGEGDEPCSKTHVVLKDKANQ